MKIYNLLLLKMNSLIILLKVYPEKPWNWKAMSLNPRLTFEYVLNHLDKPWDWNALSQNVHIKYIKENPNLPWNYICVSSNETLTFEYIIKHNFNWNWNIISANKCIKWENVKNNLNFPWDFAGLSTILDVSIILDNIDYPWDLYATSWNSTISLDFIKTHSSQNFSCDGLLDNTNISLKDLCASPMSFMIDWYEASSSDKFDWNLIDISNPSLDWDGIAGNKNVTWDIIESHLDIFINHFKIILFFQVFK